MSASRCSRESGKQGDNSSGGHLAGENTPSQQRTICGDRTHHPKLAANLVRDITKGKHANDSACKGHACQCLAVVVMFDGVRIKNFQNYIYAICHGSKEDGVQLTCIDFTEQLAVRHDPEKDSYTPIPMTPLA
jgi:hypothetical protein